MECAKSIHTLMAAVSHTPIILDVNGCEPEAPLTRKHSVDAGAARQAQSGYLAPLLPGGEPVESLLRKAQFFTPGSPTADYREVHRRGGRGAEECYRERWRHGKEVRSTHGVNCTGSCSWKV